MVASINSVNQPAFRGVSYDAAATAYFAAMSVQPNTARKNLLNNLIVGLKADGVWSLLDWLGIMAAHDAQAGLINAKTPAQVATAVNSPIFTTDRGYTGVPGTSGYVETGIADNAGVNWQRDSGTLFAYINQAPIVSASAVGLYVGNATRLSISPINPVGRVHGSTTLTSTITNSLGFIAYAHTAAAANVLYRAGVADVTDTTGSSVATTADTIAFLRSSIGYSDARIAVGGWGGGLTAAQVAALNSRLNTYLTAVGGA